ncbi:MAG: hypothetical protein JNL10_11915 [Verrucomicrobiales bacterium]|nr:hypothetical protein [Verrucomicrobiales bacterium]
MRFLGLTPEAVAARSPGVPLRRIQRTAGGSTAFGALQFGIASLVVFGTWAAGGSRLYAAIGETGAFVAWAVTFILLAGVLLAPLVIGSGNRGRFLACFALAFAAYSAVWIASWIAMPNRSGEITGAMGGTALFALVLCHAFGAPRLWTDTALYLFIGNAAGYFLGDYVHGLLRGTSGKLAWGLLYGAGFGAGIGASLFAVQSGIRSRIQAGELR